MKKIRRLQFIALMTTTMALLACNQGEYFNPYEYNEKKYENLEVTEIESQYAKYNYKDLDKYGIYSYIGYDLGYSPSVGNVKYLVVPIWFTDSDEFILEPYREFVRSDINTAYFGTSEEVGWESVKTYYEKDSFGNLHIDGVTTDWYECGKPSSDFYKDGNMSKTAQLLYDASVWAKTQVEDPTEFDADKDGYLDGIVFIYGCPDSQTLAYYTGKSTDEYSNLWGYTSHFMDRSLKKKTDPGINTFFWASYDFMYSYGEDAMERTGSCPCGYGNTRNLNIDPHTFIHEAGHMFGLPDYYDYGYSSSPALAYSMQDHNVGGHDPYSRFSLGWSKAIVPTETCRVTLKSMEESGEFILLSPSYEDSPFDEYIALELFAPDGLNEFSMTTYYSGACTGIKNPGIRMWHVDSRLYSVTKMNYYTGQITEGHVTSKPTDGRVIEATSNSSPSSGRSTDLAGKSSYNQLQVIRRDYKTYDPQEGQKKPDNRDGWALVQEDLFQPGDFFTTEIYQSQFVEKTKLNSGKYLNWAIHFEDFNEDGSMNITLIKR